MTEKKENKKDSSEPSEGSICQTKKDGNFL